MVRRFSVVVLEDYVFFVVLEGLYFLWSSTGLVFFVVFEGFVLFVVLEGFFLESLRAWFLWSSRTYSLEDSARRACEGVEATSVVGP